MTEQELRMQNIALLYSIAQELHPNEPIDLAQIVANYDRTLKETKEYFA